MSNPKKNHYTYLIVNIYSYFPRKYIGTRSTDLEPLEDLGVIYFSSTKQPFIQEQKDYPERFEYYILGVFDTREEAMQLEIKLHALYNVKVNPDYYNKCNATSTGFDITGNKEIGAKIGQIQKGVKRGPRSKEWCENISKGKKLSHSSMTVEEHKKWVDKNWPKERCDAISKGVTGEKNGMYNRTGKDHPNFGKKRSPESILKQRKTIKGRKVYKNENGETIRCLKEDSRLLKGIWTQQGVTGKQWYNNSKINILCFKNDIRLLNNEWKNGMLKQKGL